MTALRTWWRRFGGLLAAVLALVLVVPTAADAAICTFENLPVVGASADAHAAAVAAAANSEQPSRGAIGDADGACHHGHCHHTGPGVAAATTIYVASFASAIEPAPFSVTERPARLTSRLDRPPRG